MPRLFFSAGDVSGDQHCARLVQALRRRAPGLECEGLGGPAMAAAGCVLQKDLVSQAIFGFGAALAALPDMLGLLGRVGARLDAHRPDAVVLTDYPGLNLHVARVAARRGIPVVYFVAPQLWGWAPWRVRRFARVVDEALVIFPFEEAFWREAGVDAACIGHPALDGLPRSRQLAVDPSIAAEPRPVALLPGSRPREVREHGPLLLQAARLVLRRCPQASFHSAHVSAPEREALERQAREAGVPLHVHGDRVHAVMASCRAAAVASGTATLETGLLGTPLVAFYSISPTERLVWGLLILSPHVSPLNLVAGRRLCPELVFDRGRSDAPLALADALLPLLEDTPQRAAVLEGLARLDVDGHGAIERAAERIAQRLPA